MTSEKTTPFFGRERELERLKELTKKNAASLVVIKGRRRIGKSRLTEELARRLPGYRAVHFQGLPPSEGSDSALVGMLGWSTQSVLQR